MEDQVTYQTLTEDVSNQSQGTNDEAVQSLRMHEMISLAEKHEIKQGVAYIKKASYTALEKVKGEYEKKQLEETNEYLSETLMEKLSEFMEGLNMIDDAKIMEKELLHNKMVKKDLKNILGHVTPYIPLIGLVCGISIIGRHMYNKKTQPTKDRQQQE
jgi:predicted house-cleaning noncanonical NTP pyrophosphatase (MazG superfamily)